MPRRNSISYAIGAANRRRVRSLMRVRCAMSRELPASLELPASASLKLPTALELLALRDLPTALIYVCLMQLLFGIHNFHAAFVA